MNETRWQQVKALFQATVARPASERQAFLAGAARGDDALRHEVERLLAADASAPGFTGRLPVQPGTVAVDRLAAVESATVTTASETTVVAANVGPYRIMARLGAGGMGEVLRARDSKLNRDVALKVLPRAFELDLDRLARFRREAQALAALNHPHIAAIYGLEESAGRQALVLELVEGRTLAELIAIGPLPVPEALRIASQIAEALEAAHEKGIIHRDLKPANIKVTPAGVVKVLDFGLAKTVAGDLATTTRASESLTVEGATRVGVILGTAAYMSPEQARGQDVDARTDIWAFGCVLFEMLSGRQVFRADAGSDSIAKVLGDEPDWSVLPKSTPPKIRELLRECLQKNAANRLTTIAAARVTIHETLAPRGIRFSHRTAAAIAAVLIVALATGGYFVTRLGRSPNISPSEWVPLTNLDSVTQPALSPDGRMLAFIRSQSTFIGPGQVYVKLLPDGEPIALTHDDLPKMGPVFSPDGGRIAYTVNDGNSWDTWEVSAIKGEPRRWLRNASGLTWVGPGDLLFSQVKTGNHMGIIRSSESRTQTSELYFPVHGMAHRSYTSPNGQSVLAVEMDQSGIWLPCRLLAIGGGSSRLVGPRDAQCKAAAWSPDGRWMYFSADAGDGVHVWRQGFPQGEPEQITSGPTEEEGLAGAPDGKSLITSVGLTQRSVWFHDPSGDRQISLEGYAFQPLLAADGRHICFRVTRGVASGLTPAELWLHDLDSGRNERLFPGQMVTAYDLSKTNQIVAAVTEKDGKSGLWLGWLDGHDAPRRIPAVEGDIPRFGRDDEILFRAADANASVFFRVNQDGTDRTRLFRVSGGTFGTTSPDGEWLGGVSDETSDMVVYSTQGRPAVRLFPNSQTSRLRWSRDGRHAYLSIQYGQASAFGVGRTYVLPVAEGAIFPRIPDGGFRTEAEVAAAPGATVIPYGDVAPGSSPEVYAFSRVNTTRNLYRIPLR